MPKRRTPEPPDAAAARKATLRLTLGYAVASLLWILLSDQLLGALHLPPDVTVRLSQAKGFLFVVVTSLVLYFVSSDALATIRTANQRYHRLFENATEGLTLFTVRRDAQGKPVDFIVEDVNEAGTAISRVDREALIGASVKEKAGSGTVLGELVDYVYEAVVADAPRRGIEIHDDVRDLHWLASVYPIDEDTWALALVDVTEERRADRVLRDQEDAIRKAYVDVLDAVTGGKLILLGENDLDAELGEPLGEPEMIERPEQLANARAHIRGEIHRRFPESHAGRNLINPVGEALNNVLTHAGTGTYQVFALPDGTIQVEVSDRGPGIDFSNLPKATLVQGYSTAATLGAGFTIMLQMSDRVLLSTRPGRTTVVLECRDPEPVEVG